jgi:hypothetical protein
MSDAQLAPLREEAPKTARFLFALSVFLLFYVSTMALSFVGFTYDLPDGPAWQKLHPATLVAVTAFVAALALRPRPLHRLRMLVFAFPGACYFILMWFFLMAHGVIDQNGHFTEMLEPYPFSLAALFLHDDFPQYYRRKIRLLLHVLICVNALVGIAEYLTGWRVFPYVISGLEIDGDYRSTALIGHPLLNACTTGTYMLCLFLGGDRDLRPLWRVAALLTTTLAMIAFGGRTAIVSSSLVIALVTLRKIAGLLLGARIDVRHFLAGALVAPAVIGAVAAAAFSGVLDAFIARFLDDNGSGEARVIVWQLFDKFDWADLALGPRSDLVRSLLNSFGIEIGIENNWLALLFQYGAWMTFFFSCGLFALFWEFWRRGHKGITLLFVYFLIVISSAIGLATKTMIFAQFSLLLLFLFERRDITAEEASSAPVGAGFAARRASTGYPQIRPAPRAGSRAEAPAHTFD